MIDRERTGTGLKMAEGAQGHSGAGSRKHIDIIQFCRILLKLGRRFQNDMVLIELGKKSGDLALAKSIVKGVIDGRRGDAKP